MVCEELANVKGLMEGYWIIFGDFNVCRFHSEKRGCVRRTSVMGLYGGCIEDRSPLLYCKMVLLTLFLKEAIITLRLE